MLLNKKYSVIYADPPWNFKNWSDKGMMVPPVKGKGGGSKNAKMHYPCMSIKEICELPVSNIADDNCVLLMWTTEPMLEMSFDVIKSWGFKYKTMGFVWAKTNIHKLGFFQGLGYWTRANPEYCLLATKGNPKRVSSNVNTLVVSNRREHSRKPDEMYTYIEQLLGGPYIELFARNTREGWDSWGNEVNKHGNIHTT